MGSRLRSAAAIVPAVALVLSAFLAYYPAIAGDFLWDDDQYVSDNRNLHDAEGLRRIWLEPTASPQYYPLVFTTFWLEYHLWGLHPAGYHVVNILLHAVAGILLWRLLVQLAAPAPWLIAAVFVLHPVHVESVAWITERKNVLSACFYFAASLAYFRFAPLEGDQAGATGPKRWYALAILLFVAALLSKTVTGSLPAALLLVIWWKRGRLTLREVAVFMPWFVLAVAFGLLTAWLEKYAVRAAGPDWDLSWAQRWLVAGRALWFYAEKLVWPVPLIFIYPRWQLDPSSWQQHLYPVAALAVPVVAWLGRRFWGRGPLVAVLYFGGTLFPALGFIDVYPMRYSFVADHFQYLASVGLLTLLFGIAMSALDRAAYVRRPVGPLAAAVGFLVLGALTLARCHDYRDLKTLWSDTLVKNPEATIAHVNLGNVLFERGEFEEAGRHYLEAARLAPHEPTPPYNLGRVEWALGNIEAAERYFREALALQPEYPHAENNLGVMLALQHRPGDAILHFVKATAFDPTYADAFYNLAKARLELGQNEEALGAARRAQSLAPADPRFTVLVENLAKKGAAQRP